MPLLNCLLLAALAFPAAASLGDRLQEGSPLFVLFAIGVVGLAISRRKLRH
jgi:hypothetical protein